MQLKRFLTILILTAVTTTLLPAPLIVSAETSEPGSSENENFVAVGTAAGGLGDMLDATNRLVNYSDFSRSTKMNAKDQDYLTRWLPIGEALKKEAETNPAILDQYYNTHIIPDSVIKKYNLNQEEIGSLPALDVYMVNVIRNLLTDPRLKIDGAYGTGHEYLDISRLVKDYDTEKKEVPVEGVSKSQFGDLEEKLISGHSKNHAKAADFAALDYIRCTQVTYKVDNKGKPGKITDKKKLGEPVPIEFTWQANEPNQNPFGGNGPLGPTSLLDAFGANINDFIKKDFAKTYLPELVGILQDGGFSIRSVEQLMRDEKIASLNPKALHTLVGQAAIAGEIGGSLYGQYLRFRRDLPETIDATGAAIVGQSFPELAPEALLAPNLDIAADVNARKKLGERLFGSEFRFDGSTTDELFTNFAYQYISSKIFDLTPTSELGQLPLTTAATVRSSLGRIAASQWLGIALNQLVNKNHDELIATLGERLSNPTDLDQQFGLPLGTTNDLIQGHKSPDQYFETLGDTVIHDALDAYANDTFVRSRAFGLDIAFMGTEDLYYPTEPAYATINDTVTEINRLYRDGPAKLITDGDWLDFVDLATELDRRIPGHSGGITGGLNTINLSDPTGRKLNFVRDRLQTIDRTITIEERDTELKNRLYEILKDPVNFIDIFTAGQATPADYLDLGQRIFVRALTTQPFHQLAFLQYLKTPTHEIWEVPINIDLTSTPPDANLDFLLAEHTSPVFDPDQLAIDKLGFVPGYLDWLIKDDAFTTAVLPFFATNLFIQATGNPPPDNGFLTNLPRNVLWGDKFVLDKFTALRQILPEVNDTEALRTRLASLTTNDWLDDPLTSREQKIDRLIHDLYRHYVPLKQHLTATEQAAFAKAFASLVAGQDLGSIYHLTPPKIASNRALGLDNQAMSDLLNGDRSPQAASRLLGSRMISHFVFDADDPDQMASDLHEVASNANQYSLRGFYNTYETKLNDVGRLITKSLNLQNTENMTGTTIMSMISGNRPAFARTGSNITHQSVAGTPGSIMALTGNELLKKTGIGNFLAAAGITRVPTNLTGQDLTKQMFNDFSGLKWAEDTAKFLQINNGPQIFEKLGIAQNVVNQVRSVWDTNNPQATIQLLSNPSFWQQLPVDQGFTNLLGSDVGRGVSTVFQGIFTSNRSTGDLLGPIAAGAGILLGDKLRGVDVTPIIRGIQSGGDLTGPMINFGQTLLANRFGQQFSGISDLATLIASGKGTSTQIIDWGMTNIPRIFGDTTLGPIVQLGGQLTSFFKQGNFEPQAILGIASQIGQLVGIPIPSDIARAFSNPVGLGLSLASRLISSNLDSAFGGSAFSDVRKALIGPSTQDFTDQTKETIQETSRKDSVATGAQKETPEDRQKMVTEKVNQGVKDATKQLRDMVNYSTADAMLGLNKGTTEAMMKGDGKAKIDALFGEAGKFLPPEVQPLAEAFRGYFKGEGLKLDGVLDSMYGLTDGYLAQAIGFPVPRDFTKQVVGLFDGKTNFADFQNNMGNFALGAVSGFLDQKMGLPVGTSNAIYQGVTQFADLSTKLAAAQAAFDTSANALNRIGLDLAKADMRAFQGQLAGMAVSLVFGKQLNQMDQALGLPPGTASFFVSSAITSLFGGGAFLNVLAAAAPWFAAGLILGSLLAGEGLFGGIFGGTQKVTQTMCAPGGYYPFITPDDDRKAGKKEDEITITTYDPNSDLEKYHLIKDRLTRDEMVTKLGLSPGYPGEFLGEKGIPEEQTLKWEDGKKASARWKIRELTGDLLGMQLPDKFGANIESGVDTRYQPAQIILYKIPESDMQTTKDPKLDLGYDGDYLLSYDSRPHGAGSVQPTNPATLDRLPPFNRTKLKNQLDNPRFMRELTVGGTNTLTKVKVGILDWEREDGGYGSGEPGSMQYLHERDAPELNRGVWSEDSQEYWQHIHLMY